MEDKKDKKNDISYKYIPVSVYDVKPIGKKGIRGKQHHEKKSSRSTYSPFPGDVAEWCAEYFLKQKNNIFDPFAGWGERHSAIKKAGKNYTGYDISLHAIQHAYEKYGVQNTLANSLTEEIPVHDGLLTCPPYWNLEKYSKEGIDHIKKWGDFLDAAMKIKDLNKRSLHVIDIFIKLIQKKNITSEYVDNFMCFDNDNKIEEYKFWKKYFLKNKSSKDQLKKLDIQNIIPSAGEGSRHKKLGYSVPKPLIPIARKKMFERSIESLPNPSNNLFIFRY